MVDWLPWNHTFGGNHNFGLVIYNGGTLYIDDGKPVPGLIEKTVRNLREIAPTVYFNVPRGFEELVPYLRQRRRRCASSFFSRLGMLFYAGAGLPQPVWDAMDELAVRGLRRAHPLGDRPRRHRDRAVGDLFTRGDGVRSGDDRLAGAGRRSSSSCRTATRSRCASAGPTSRPVTGASRS